MTDFKVDKEKAKASLLYIAANVPNIDQHKLYKILYFAEQEHLVKYGKPITGDAFIKMQYGPVPSYIRDKVEHNTDVDGSVSRVGNTIVIEGYPDLDELADSDIECLDNSISNNKDKSFSQLVKESHSDAWTKADISSRIYSIDIAKEGNADDAIINYIQSRIEDSQPIY